MRRGPGVVEDGVKHGGRLDFEGRDLVVFAVWCGLSFGVVLLAALGFSWFDGAGILYVLGYTVAAGAHGCVAALAVGVIAVSLHDDWTNFRSWHQVVAAVLAVLLAGGAFFLDRWIVHLGLSGVSTVAYFIFCGLAIVGAGVLTWFTLDRDRFTGSAETWAVYFADGMTGVAVGAASMVLVVAGLAFWRQHGTAHAHVPSIAVKGITGEYVALGDSYSAGEGLQPFNPGTASDCHRSEQGYPQVMTFAGVRPAERFAACSGAVALDVYHGFDHRLAQVDGKVHPEVGLVTMTMSGNDMTFSKIIIACFVERSCLTSPYSPGPLEQPRYIDYPPRQTLTDWVVAAAKSVNRRMVTLFTQLRHDYPAARIVVLGYPYLFPSGHAPWKPNDCAAILRRFSYTERTGIRRLQDQFNAMLYADTVQTGLEFVSPVAAWDGHEPCGRRGQFTNSIKPVIGKDPLDHGTFHPNVNGQREFAYLVSCYVDGNPKPPNPFVHGTAHPFLVNGLVSSPASLGLLDPPGAASNPVRC